MHKDERIPWTHEELQAMLPKVEAQLEQAEAESQEEGTILKPLPPMTVEECKEYFWRLMDSAAERPLTLDECGLHGQLLAQYEQAVMARFLGKKGRYYVISEDNVLEMMSNR